MFKIKYFYPSEIFQIKDAWRKLEKGDDNTYFQTYTWYSGLLSLVLEDGWLYETRVAGVYKDDEIVLIAPLFIIKHTFGLNKSGMYFWGRCGWSDYLNLIYEVFIPQAYEFLINDLVKKYHLSRICWEQLKESTQLYTYLINSKKNTNCLSTKCVSLQIPSTEKEYLSLLSKHSRQNLRTAENRAMKDNLSLRFVFDDNEVNLNSCDKIRAVRLVKKNKPRNILSYIKKVIIKYTTIKYNNKLPYYFDKASKIMVVYNKEIPIAFFNYGISNSNKSIVLMAVGTDEHYERYSPGMQLIYRFIKEKISDNTINYIDFTRGTERYKYALGGKEHVIFNLRYNIK